MPTMRLKAAVDSVPASMTKNEAMALIPLIRCAHCKQPMDIEVRRETGVYRFYARACLCAAE